MNNLDKLGEALLTSRIEYAKNVINLINDYDIETVKRVVQGDIAQANDTLSSIKARQYEADAKADHITGNIPNV